MVSPETYVSFLLSSEFQRCSANLDQLALSYMYAVPAERIVFTGKFHLPWKELRLVKIIRPKLL